MQNYLPFLTFILNIGGHIFKKKNLKPLILNLNYIYLLTNVITFGYVVMHCLQNLF